jgi:RNA polymerase sigma-70 factor (ECF subfamily)
VPAGAADPELDYLKTRCKDDFREAFVHALGSLTTDERNALRLHHLDGLTLDETAAVCQVGRATAARWLANARARILRETERRLTARLALEGRDVDSMLRLVQSQLDVSIRRHLGEITGRTDESTRDREIG